MAIPLLQEFCSVGMRVRLHHPRKQYNLGSNNPAVGSKYECAGTISNVTDSNVSVIWDNGGHNIYYSTDLALDEENLGRCKSIWDE